MKRILFVMLILSFVFVRVPAVSGLAMLMDGDNPNVAPQNPNIAPGPVVVPHYPPPVYQPTNPNVAPQNPNIAPGGGPNVVPDLPDPGLMPEMFVA